MLGGIMTEGFKRMMRFSGRMDRTSFWTYFLVLLFAAQGLLAIAMVPVFAMAGADGSSDRALRGMSPIQYLIVPTAVIALLYVALIAAAVARRLHDTGRSGWWGAMPLPFLLAGFPLMDMLFGDVMTGVGQPDMRLFGLLFANNAIYMLLLVVLAILLSIKSQPAANIYGPPPATDV